MILNHFDPKVLEMVLLMSELLFSLVDGRGIPLKLAEGSHLSARSISKLSPSLPRLASKKSCGSSRMDPQGAKPRASCISLLLLLSGCVAQCLCFMMFHRFVGLEWYLDVFGMPLFMCPETSDGTWG